MKNQKTRGQQFFIPNRSEDNRCTKYYQISRSIMSDLLRRAFEHLGLNNFSSLKETLRIRLQQLIPKLKQRKIMIPAPVVIGIVLFILDYWIRVVKKPKLYHNVNETNQEILNKCPSLRQAYWPTIWCYNNHLNTIAGVLFRGHVSFDRRREILSLEDSGVLGLDWFEDKITANDDRVPIVLFIPGLNGGSRSIYLRHTAKEMRRRMRVKCVAMNYRGTNGTELLTPKSYCGAYTEDLRQVCNHIRSEYPEAPIFAVGYSLGSNILVKYLGEEGDKTPLSGAVSVSNPFDFVKSSEVMAKSPFYNWQLTSSTVKTFRGQQEAYRNVPELDFDVILKSKRLRDFDDKFTRVVFGYPSVDAYYKDASSGEYIHRIGIPTMLVNAYDDPIVDPTALPREQAQDNKNVILAVTKKGGHVSFVEGLWPGGTCYVDRVIAEYIQALIELRKNNINNNNVNNTHDEDAE